MAKLSTSEINLRFFGERLATPTFAIGSSITTTIAAKSIVFISSLAQPWMFVVLFFIFLSETVVATYFFKKAVPDTLVSCFIDNPFQRLTSLKKVLLGLGIFASIGSGIAFGALTFVSTTSAITTVLGFCPPFGIVLASVLALSAVLCLTCLFIRHIEDAIRNDVHLKVLNFFKNICTRDKTKPLVQQILEVFFKLLCVSTIVALTVVGTIATLGTIQGGLSKFLLLIPGADELAVTISSSIIAYGLMGPARLPWLLTAVCTCMSSVGETIGRKLYQLSHALGSVLGLCTPIEEHEEASKAEKCSWTTMGVALLKLSAVTIHGFSFGALARSGGGAVLANVMNIPQETAELLALIGQGGAQTAVSAHSLFGKKPSPPPDGADDSWTKDAITLKEIIKT